MLQRGQDLVQQKPIPRDPTHLLVRFLAACVSMQRIVYKDIEQLKNGVEALYYFNTPRSLSVHSMVLIPFCYSMMSFNCD